VRGIREFGRQDGENSLQIRKHLIVPETNDPKIVFREPMISLHISHGVGVLTAIHFHHQPRPIAEKVRDVRPNWNLTPKLE
jgi:hypothetical protein